MYIGNRRVTDLNRWFIEQKAVLQPIFFKVLQYFFIWYFAKTQEKLDKTKLLSITIGKFLKGYDNFVRNLGYRKYTFKDIGNNDKSLIKERYLKFIEWDKRNPLERRRAGVVDYEKDPFPAREFFAVPIRSQQYILKNF